MIDAAFWAGKRVLVTGHTGFVGGWTSACLCALGAKVTGYALAPPTRPSFYDLVGLAGRVDGITADIRSSGALAEAFATNSPEIVLHLAAQSLVSIGWERPAETFDINVGGSVNILEQACRSGTEALVIVSTDKVYDTRRADAPFREHDPLDATDPYGASKVCCELTVAAYARRYAAADIGLATVRAGNAIGGGDWGLNRLIPDVVRALSSSRSLSLRKAHAVRPWHHVLDMVSGILAVAQHAGRTGGPIGAWNIGPSAGRVATAERLARMAADAWGSSLAVHIERTQAFPETDFLALDTSKAQHTLGVSSPWDLERAVEFTMEWYRRAQNAQDAWEATLGQIAAYRAALAGSRPGIEPAARTGERSVERTPQR